MNCDHDNRQPYKYALGRRLTLLCQPCHDSLVAQTGMVLTPTDRRTHDEPHPTERRRTFRPAWLGRLTGRDETGLAA